MNTKGKVQGRIIIEIPAMYEITNQEGKDNSCPELIAVSFVNPKIPPKKIRENKKNTIKIKDFFTKT